MRKALSMGRTARQAADVGARMVANAAQVTAAAASRCCSCDKDAWRGNRQCIWRTAWGCYKHVSLCWSLSAAVEPAVTVQWLPHEGDPTSCVIQPAAS